MWLIGAIDSFWQLNSKMCACITVHSRLYRSNWFPDELPSDDDKSYRYFYVGSRRVDPTKLLSNHCVNGAFSAGFIIENTDGPHIVYLFYDD